MDIWLNTRERLLRTTDEIHHGQDLSSFNFSFTLIFFFFCMECVRKQFAKFILFELSVDMF